ncbi:MAG TPA: hypothetical protein VJN96_12880 [Vicinamibacterales bacterium]|nr:hypothetical protein [Vicinamibacterales bacterium]
MIRCSFINAHDGKQCRRNVKDGAPGDLCHIHLGQSGGAVKPRSDNPDVILQRLLRDPKPAIRLKALDMWLKRSPSPVTQREKWEDRATSEEQNMLRFALAIMNVVRKAHGFAERVLAPYTLARESRASIAAMLAEVPEVLQAPAYNDVPGPTIGLPDGASTKSPLPTRKSPSEIPTPRDWAKAGLFTLEGGTRLTHVRGDEHADKILSGEIPFLEACLEEQFHQKQLARMRRSE